MAKQHTVMIIEDDEALNEAFTTLLRKENFEVVSVFNGQEALDILATDNAIELILLDLLMPVMNGKEFLQKFNNSNQIPVIVFSNLDTQTDIEEVKRLGATRYILKAWASPKDLAKVVRETIAEKA